MLRGSVVAWVLMWVGLVPALAAEPAEYDLIIRGGTLYDGSGGKPVAGDLAIRGERIAAVGDLGDAKAVREIDAQGLAVAPGFINMLSWATESLLIDGRSQSDIRQGVTLEVFGEGWSMGPLNAQMRKDMVAQQGDEKFDVPWTTLGEYLSHLEKQGVSCNVASFVGATTIRIHVLGYEDRKPTAAELVKMRKLVRQAMEEGAMGVGSSLIYAPAFYAETDELIELCKVAAEYQGMYISHMRSEGNQLIEAIEELIRISREAGLPAEIYHLKTAGQENWSKRDPAIELVERRPRLGPAHHGGHVHVHGRFDRPERRDAALGTGRGLEAVDRPHCAIPTIRKRVVQEMRTPTDAWENLLLGAGTPDNVLLVGFKNKALKHLTGKTLAEVARQRGTSPEETAMDLVIEDNSRVDTVYFMMQEEDVRKNVAIPWVSFGSDAGSIAPKGIWLLSQPHPRTYGNVARLLGKYVRDEKIIPLEEAVRKLTSLPAGNLGLKDRGSLQPGYFADVAVFDPAKIKDHATFEVPHQYSTGMVHVLVNGTPVLADGEHTGATPGQAVWGRGRK